MPQHVKTIDILEGYFQKTLNDRIDETKAKKTYKKGDFIKRKPGEIYTDDKGQKWQTIPI